MTDREVQILNTKCLLDDFLKVQETTLRYRKFNGELSETVRRLSLERGNSAAAILHDTSTDEILLVEQFKWPTYEADGGWIVETVAGVIDVDEDPDQAAIRETLEETGYAVEQVEFICRFYGSAGGTSEQIYLYFAEVDDAAKVREGGGLAEEGEDIRLRRYSLDSAVQAVRDGKIIDAKAIIGINWMQLKRFEEK